MCFKFWSIKNIFQILQDNKSLIMVSLQNYQIRSSFWSAFSCIRIEYGDLPSKSPYSVRVQENTDQKKLRIWTFSTQCVIGN